MRKTILETVIAVLTAINEALENYSPTIKATLMKAAIDAQAEEMKLQMAKSLNEISENIAGMREPLNELLQSIQERSESTGEDDEPCRGSSEQKNA